MSAKALSPLTPKAPASLTSLDIPITVIGAKDLIIAASPDGILVTHKAESPRIKEVLKTFEQRPMYEERRWGHYKVIDYVKYDEGNEVLTKRIFINEGKNISYQLHHKRSEIWTFVSGEASIVINEKMHKVKAGDVVRIPEGTKHAILALTDVEFIEVQTGSEPGRGGQYPYYSGLGGYRSTSVHFVGLTYLFNQLLQF